MKGIWNQGKRWKSAIACSTVVFALFLIVIASGPNAQTPEKFTNLQVLPKDISRDSLEATMHGFTDALGVHCSYCHVRPQPKEGQGRVEPDFASDAKPEKLTARVMLAMVHRINGTELTQIKTDHPDHVTVTCRTCHRGQSRPWQVEDVLTQSYHTGGFDSLTAKYEALRKDYYGTDTYNLGESMLPDLGETLAGPDSAGVRVRFAEYNLKWFPQSAYTYVALGQARGALGDKDQALKDLNHAAELDPTLKDYVQRVIEHMKTK